MNDPNSFSALKSLLSEEEEKERADRFSNLKTMLEKESSKLEDICERILAHLESNPDASLRELRKLGKSEKITAALTELETSGRLSKQTRGAGKPVKFILLPA